MGYGKHGGCLKHFLFSSYYVYVRKLLLNPCICCSPNTDVDESCVQWKWPFDVSATHTRYPYNLAFCSQCVSSLFVIE